MEGFIGGAEFRFQTDSDPAIGSCMSSSSAVFRKIEFHQARKPFNGFSNGGAEFKIETLNAGSDPKRPGSDVSLFGMGGKKRDRSDFWESGLDPELFGSTFRKIGPGLANLGNTCFLNSVLQCLTYTEPLAAYLQSGKHQESCHVAGFCALCAIQEHVKSALQKSGGILVPKRLVSNLRCISRNFRNSRQEDAHEYMINLLESMHKCCLPSGMPSESPKAYEKSLVHKIFGGSLRSQVKCTQCSHCSDKFDPFLDLSLDIMKADSLQKALSHFTAAELLDDGARVYHCERCKQKVRAAKHLTVHKAPYVLTIHLKRFEAHHSKKIDKKVQFGPTIDMKPFVSGSCGGDLKYTLYGVLVHYGWTIHSGHYSCFVRTSSGMWYSLDDNRVVQVSEKTVMDQKAYMLFYVRDRKNIVAKNKTSPSFHAISTERANNSIVGKLCGVGSPAATAQKNANNVCAPKETLLKLVSSPQTNEQMMAKSAVLKEDPVVKPLTNAPSFNGNGGIQSFVNTSTSGDKTGNCVGEKNSMNKLDVSVSASSSGNPPLSSHGDKLASSGTSQKLNLPSDSGPQTATNPGNPTDKTSDEILSVASAGNSSKSVVTEQLPNKQSCENNQVEIVSSSNSLNKGAVNIGQNVAHESTDLTTPCGMQSESRKITLDMTAHVKSKKLQKYHVKNMHMGLRFFKLSLRLRKKKKHKRSKRSAIEIKNLNEEVLSQGDVADLGSSASEPTRTFASDSQGKVKNVKRNFDGDSANDATFGEFRERIHQNGCVLASDEHSLKRSGMSEASHEVSENRDSSRDSQKVPSERDTMNMLTRGLEETVVATWDLGTHSQIIGSNSKSTSIGYVPDEWDEEYDRGKRKKIRSQKHTFGGPNPFQLVASKKAHLQKKAKD